MNPAAIPADVPSHGGDSRPTSSEQRLPFLRCKLAVGAADDPQESEADRAAEAVMCMKAPPGLGRSAGPPLVRRLGANNSAAAMWEAPHIIHEALRSPGRPLDRETMEFMEPRFGRDLSGVRIHTGAQAAASARAIKARAYTAGNHIVWDAGSYAPGTETGKRLLAHELAHVLQGSCRDESIIRRQTKTDREPTVVAEELLVLGRRVGASSEFPDAERMRGVIRRDSDPAVIDQCTVQMIGAADVVGTRFRFVHPGLGRIVDATYSGRSEDGSSWGFLITYYWQPHAAIHSGQDPTPPGKAPAESVKPADRKSVPKTPDEIQAELAALPAPVMDVLRGAGEISAENQAQYLRIARKLAQLQPEDLAMYKLLAKRLAADLDSFEQSVDFFIQFKAQISAQAGAENAQADTGKEPTLEAKLADTWSGFDEQKFATMNTAQKEDVARDIAAKQRNIQLAHMASHPGESALGMVEGMVRLDKTAKAIAEDVKDAADGNKGAYTRIAGAVGAYNKYVAAAASVVFVALLFVPGVNLVELAAAGLAVAAATIVLSTVEAELRIKAAGEAATAEDFKSETAKSAAAQTQAIVAAAMLALTLAMKLIARIPLPGRYQNVGAALKSAQAALLDKTGVGPAWQTIKADLVSRLSTAKQGLAEALAEQLKAFSSVKKTVESLSGPEFVKHLADGDPQLAELGISSDQGAAVQQVSGTPEGQAVPERLRQDVLKALDDAPAEAQKKVDDFVKNVDSATAAFNAAKTEEQLKAAVAGASEKLSPEEQVKVAAKDEQDFVKRRVTSARKSEITAKAKQQLAELGAEKAKTTAEIERLDSERSDVRIKINRLKARALELPRDDPARAAVMTELNSAKQALADLDESDALGGARKELREQNEAEERILQSLELKRPKLTEANKRIIEAAAKKNAAGQFLDANTDEPINGTPEYGHIYGKEHRRLVLEAAEKGMDQAAFDAWVNEHPEWFQLETPANNRSHRFEKPGVN